MGLFGDGVFDAVFGGAGDVPGEGRGGQRRREAQVLKDEWRGWGVLYDICNLCELRVLSSYGSMKPKRASCSPGDVQLRIFQFDNGLTGSEQTASLSQIVALRPALQPLKSSNHQTPHPTPTLSHPTKRKPVILLPIEPTYLSTSTQPCLPVCFRLGDAPFLKPRS